MAGKRLTKAKIEVLEAVAYASIGNKNFFDGDVLLAIEDAQSRGLSPSEFFKLLEDLARDDYIGIKEGPNRHGYVTDYVLLTRKGFNVIEPG